MSNSNPVRIVLDTNVLLSACLKPEGLEAQALALALSGTVEACVTQAVLDEYADVLTREKFRAFRDRARTALDAIQRAAVRVTAGDIATGASDEDDNRFLECAAAGAADYLITGNLRHYPAQWGCTRVVNARGFFDLRSLER